MEGSKLITKLQNYGINGTRKGISGECVDRLLEGYAGLSEFLMDTDTSAVIDPITDRQELSHCVLKSFTSCDFDLLKFGIPVGTRVAVLVPNGPELAVCLIALVTRWCVAPINPNITPTEIQSELKSTKCKAVILLAGDPTTASTAQIAHTLGLGVLILTPSTTVCGLFTLEVMYSVKNISDIQLQTEKIQNSATDVVLLLHTSGTSGKKKLVPYTLNMLVVGVGCIVSSWNLSSHDICLNMMPLFHIGGIVRNIFSPILAGGAVITCPAFDPILFWDILESRSFTWYYAAPTMHHAVLQEAARRKEATTSLPVEPVRFVANAAGGLLPALAASLKEVFDATILTSYGMTECMPISTPPQTYKMDPVGTSGTPVGPDICIVGEDMITVLPPGGKGHIMVRGPPCFGGYERNEESNDALNDAFFTVNGQDKWFCTGDCGHLDEAGYLFISGRSKEIINRGGETISPFEIEEAVISHPDVREVMCFSSPHSQYQETVGAVIVTEASRPRPDIHDLHKHLDNSLHRSKWPQIVVYMDALPKNASNKVLRVRFAERAQLPAVDDDTSPISRLYEGKCPPNGTPLGTPIEVSRVVQDIKITEAFLRKQDGVDRVAVTVLDLPSQRDAVVAFITPSTADTSALQATCESSLHTYLCPLFIHATDTLGEVPMLNGNNTNGSQDALVARAVEIFTAKTVVLPRNEMEEDIEKIWREQLMFDRTLSVTSSFFELGGDSLRAGGLVSAIRKKFDVAMTVADLFTSPTIESMAQKISFLISMDTEESVFDFDDTYSEGGDSAKLLRPLSIASPKDDVFGGVDTDPGSVNNWEYSMKLSSTSWGCLITQLIPFVLVFPARRLSMWFLIAGPWVMFMNLGIDRFPALIMAMLLMRVVSATLFPLFGVLCKWLIIGKYKPGRYPIWGVMYLKWWLVEQIIRIVGTGIFRDDFPLIGTFLVRFYYTLMGASIGKNVKIHRNAQLGQADLLAIGDNVVIDDAVVRPFALEEGHMILLPIVIGDRCSIGVKSVVAPGAVVSSGTHIGPLSSSHEREDADPRSMSYCRTAFPSPPLSLIVLIGIPVLATVAMVSYAPWVIVLRAMVNEARDSGWYSSDLNSIYDAFLWWITPQRMIYYFALRVIQRCIVPPVKLLVVILIKWSLIGKFVPQNTKERLRPYNLFRYWLMSKLLPGGDLAGVARLVGTHYEVISMIYRALGAKVGKRVYWPGTGLDIVEYDMFEVGDDVVFGSRSVIMTSSAKHSSRVVLEAGSMVADRCVVLPGVILRRGCVLGSGSLAHEGFEGAVGSMWVGSRGGSAAVVSPEDESFRDKDTNSPFGRAFYGKDASYCVLPLWLVASYNTIWQGFCVCYHNCPLLLSLFLAQYFAEFNESSLQNPLTLFRMSMIAFIPVYIVLSLSALAFDVVAKWVLIGRRVQGDYAWDTSSYCQRWQLHLTLQEIRRGERQYTGILELFCGSPYLVWYFRALGCKIGENVCLYPNGGDPMMTEPDLVTIGDDCCIDNASLIAHINTRGFFKLNPIEVGDGCVLKSNTRLLSGSGMEDHSVLLEHTLVISGEMVDSGSVWQGWPSHLHYPLGEHRSGLTNLLSTKDLELMSIFLSTNSASSIASMKRRKRRQHADRKSRSSPLAVETSGGFLSRFTQGYEPLSSA